MEKRNKKEYCPLCCKIVFLSFKLSLLMCSTLYKSKCQIADSGVAFQLDLLFSKQPDFSVLKQMSLPQKAEANTDFPQVRGLEQIQESVGFLFLWILRWISDFSQHRLTFSVWVIVKICLFENEIAVPRCTAVFIFATF